MISGCSNATSTHIIKKDFSKPSMTELSYDEVKQKIKDKEDFVLYIGRPDCLDCQEFDPYLKDYLKDNKGVYIYTFNTKKYRDLAKEDNATKKNREFYDQLYKEFHISWTPTMHFIYKGKFEKTYTYLNEEFYSLSNEQQKKKKKEFIKEFKSWMSDIYD